MPTFSQLFTPISWKSDKILWSTYSIVPDIEEEVSYPRMWFQYSNYPMFSEGNMYQVANLFSGEGHHGHFIQKIDMKTGRELWSNSRWFRYFLPDRQTNPVREFFQSPFLKGDSLQLYYFKEFTPPAVNLIWERGKIGKLSYDKFNGQIIKEKATNSNDVFNATLSNGLAGTASQVFVSDDEGNIKYVEINRPLRQDWKLLRLKSILLNEKGHVLKTMEKDIRMELDIRNVASFRISDNKILVFVQCPDVFDEAKDIIRLLIIDDNLNILKDYDISNHLPMTKTIRNWVFNILQISIDDNRFNLNARLREEEVAKIFSFDFDGNLLETIDIPLLGNRIQANVLSIPTRYEKGSIVVMNELETPSDRQRSKTSIKIYKSDGYGQLTFLEELLTDDDLINHYYYASLLFWTPDNNLLLHIRQIDRAQIGQIVEMDWLSNVLIDSKKLGLLSSVSSIQQLSPPVYPNPAHNIISIPNTIEGSLVDVFTVEGRFLYTKSVSDQQVDISDLSPGIYFLSITLGNTSHKYKFVKH